MRQLVSDIATDIATDIAIDITGGSTPAFSPLSLYPSALYTMAAPYLYTDTEKTEPASLGDKVRNVEDWSGNGHDLAPTNDARRPIYAGIPVALGDEVVSALGDWTAGTGWSVTDGVATKTAGTASSLSVAASLTAGQMYAIFINCTRTAGTVQVRFTGGTSVLGLAMNTNKSHTEYFVAESGNTTIELHGDSAFAGTVTRISVKPATEVAGEGLYFNGIDNFVISPNVDLSGGQQMTVAVSYWRDDRLGAAAPWEVGGYTALANHGSLQRIYGSSPSARSRDGSQGAAGFTYNHEGSALHSTRAITDFIDVDFSQAALQDQIKGETSGVPAPATYSGSALSVTALPTGPVALGAANNGSSDFRGIIHRAAVIPRLLTATEKRDVDDWLMPGPRCGAIGDSTVGPNLIQSGQPSNVWRCSAFIPDAEFNYHDVTSPGDKIADQKTKWEALTDYSSLNAVFIQVGQNDANTYALTKTAAQIIADLQDLVDTVSADVPAGCKIYICALTPSREWLGNSTDAAAAYAHWQAINEAIEGLGSNPIAGVDGRITGKSGGLYWAALNDGSDNLLQAYDHNDDGVHPSNEGKFIIAQAWRAQLKADGLL